MTDRSGRKLRGIQEEYRRVSLAYNLFSIQTEAALSAIQNLYLLAPLPFMIAMPILYYFYKLDKIYPQVMAELTERERQGKL